MATRLTEGNKVLYGTESVLRSGESDIIPCLVNQILYSDKEEVRS